MSSDDLDVDASKIKPLSEEEFALLKKKIELEDKSKPSAPRPKVPTTVGPPTFLFGLVVSAVAVLIIGSIGTDYYLKLFGSFSAVIAVVMYILLWLPKFRTSLTVMLFIFFCVASASLFAGILGVLLMAVIAYAALHVKNDA